MHDTEIDEIDGSEIIGEIIGEGDVVFAKIRSAVRHSLIAFDAHSCIRLIAFDAHSCIQFIASIPTLPVDMVGSILALQLNSSRLDLSNPSEWHPSFQHKGTRRGSASATSTYNQICSFIQSETNARLESSS
jgi:hypothetical protein